METSTYGAELVAAKIAVEEAIGIIHTLRSIGVPIDGPVDIYVDNQAVVNNLRSPGGQLKKKHLSIAYHMIREYIALGLIRIRHNPGTDNIADPFTKALPSPTWKKHMDIIMTNYKPNKEE